MQHVIPKKISVSVLVSPNKASSQKDLSPISVWYIGQSLLLRLSKGVDTVG